MARTKVIATSKFDENIVIEVSILDDYPSTEEGDEHRITKAYFQLKVADMLSPSFIASPMRFRNAFTFTFE